MKVETAATARRSVVLCSPPVLIGMVENAERICEADQNISIKYGAD